MQLFDIVNPWESWLVAALLCILLMICAIQPRSISLSLQALSSPIQRRYAHGGNAPVLFLLRAIYQLGTITLAIMLGVTAYMGCTHILPYHYLLAVAWMMAVVLTKGIVDKWIQLIFRFPVNETTYLKYRSELWQILGLLLWVYIFFSPWFTATLTWIIPIVLIGLYLIVLWWKIMQVFGWTIQHVCYSLLYVLHVEILPIALMMGGIVRIIQ